MSHRYGDEPPTPAQRGLRRKVGAGAITLVAGLLLVLHALRQQRAASRSVRVAFDALAAGDLEAAGTAFAGGLGSLSPDPLAMLGVATVQDIPGMRGRPLPSEPAATASLSEREVIARARLLLAHRLPARALAWIGRARAHLGRRRSLAVVQVFAEMWVRAARRRAATKTRPSARDP